jgi:saccharopine dehydrogenase (NAD+, L-lysine-forming)
VPFPRGERTVGATVWGDLVTAYRSTGIPNITVYTRLPRQTWRARLLRFAPLRHVIDLAVQRRLGGPHPDLRAISGCQVWGEVRDPDGNSRTAWLTGPNGYDLTADAMVRAVGYLHAGSGPAGPIRAGAHTPATALGAAFVEELDGVTVTPPSA